MYSLISYCDEVLTYIATAESIDEVKRIFINKLNLTTIKNKLYSNGKLIDDNDDDLDLENFYELNKGILSCGFSIDDTWLNYYICQHDSYSIKIVVDLVNAMVHCNDGEFEALFNEDVDNTLNWHSSKDNPAQYLTIDNVLYILQKNEEPSRYNRVFENPDTLATFNEYKEYCRKGNTVVHSWSDRAPCPTAFFTIPH